MFYFDVDSLKWKTTSNLINNWIGSKCCKKAPCFVSVPYTNAYALFWLRAYFNTKAKQMYWNMYFHKKKKKN